MGVMRDDADPPKGIFGLPVMGPWTGRLFALLLILTLGAAVLLGASPFIMFFLCQPGSPIAAVALGLLLFVVPILLVTLLIWLFLRLIRRPVTRFRRR